MKIEGQEWPCRILLVALTILFVGLSLRFHTFPEMLRRSAKEGALNEMYFVNNKPFKKLLHNFLFCFEAAEEHATCSWKNEHCTTVKRRENMNATYN